MSMRTLMGVLAATISLTAATALIATAADTPPRPDTDKWPAFIIPWEDTTNSITDMSRLLAKPAGKQGFITIHDGHLATPDNQRWRIWGQNITLSVPMPPMDIAPIIARRMAKFGINCLRLHHIDHRWPDGILMRHSSGTPAPIARDQGIPWDGRGESTQALDPEALARFDWFFKCCKDQGIYVDLNLNVSRVFTEADGVRDADKIGFAKGLTYFDDRLIVLQKEYARQLLTHVNPFTGLRYADDPAVAIIEILNENSLLECWQQGRLRGQAAQGQTWGDIPPSYAADLDQRWNKHLLTKYATRQALAAAWSGHLADSEDPATGTVKRLQPDQFAAADPVRFADELRFYQSLENNFFADMQQFLRKDLGAHQLIIATSDWRGGTNLPLLESHANADIMDRHGYWQGYWETPKLRRNERPAKEWYKDWYLKNTAMIDAPDQSLPATLISTMIKGKPFIVSEINEHFPNDFASECLPVNTAYALLQDWDGIFWFGYAGGDWEGVFNYPANLPRSEEVLMTQAICRFEWMCNDPTKMSLSAIGAQMFLRGDIAAARQLIERQVTPQTVVDNLRTKSGGPYGTNLPARLGLVHRTALTSFTAPTNAPDPSTLTFPKGPITSDTGELTWIDSSPSNALCIDTPREQAIIGHQGTHQTTQMTLTLATPFAAVQLASLDDNPISTTENMLLVAAARVANTGMTWSPNGRCSITDQWGGPPTRIEPVEATIQLRNLKTTQLEITPLDGRGQPKADTRKIPVHNGTADFSIGAADATVWYHLSTVPTAEKP